ncbi:hypothetical protein [Rhizobium laguerreae]|uniref:hypothetical protein n=1 Tax=Rhizobium laguerreae TaxID=1076926 RepID=UPI0021B0C974|nr:hypothetical protein [Rhizobium laguerreae]MBY3512380.1 hypothetical protein [Rhizobium laguerreae]
MAMWWQPRPFSCNRSRQALFSRSGCRNSTSILRDLNEHDNPADWRRFARRSIEHIKALGL